MFGFVFHLNPCALTSALTDWHVLLLIVNNAALGIVVSLFLRKLNSILKTFASALELMFTAVLSWFDRLLFFSQSTDLNGFNWGEN